MTDRVQKQAALERVRFDPIADCVGLADGEARLFLAAMTLDTIRGTIRYIGANM